MQNTNRILIVDDDARVRFVLDKVLVKLGGTYEIMTAKDGRDALRALKSSTFDLLITDLRLPRLTGINLTDVFLQQQPEAAVIWMTAYGCYRVREQAKQRGVYRCLDKPMEIDEVREAVVDAFQSVKV